MSKLKILFIVNPISGITQKKQIPERIEALIDTKIIDFEIRKTQYRHHAVILAAEAVAEKFDIVVAVGGDGSVNEVSSQLINTSTALGIIPLGSGNGWARHFKLPLNTDKAIKIFNNHKKIKVDTGIVNDRHFINCAGLGFDAAVANHFAGTILRGFFSYVFSTLHQYSKFNSQEYSIQLDEHNIKGTYFMISIMNGTQFGYNLKCLPHANPNDGYFDVLLIKKFSKLFVPLLAFHAITNSLSKCFFCKVYKAKNVEIKSKSMMQMQVDGEPIKIKKEATLSLLHNSLNMIVGK